MHVRNGETALADDIIFKSSNGNYDGEEGGLGSDENGSREIPPGGMLYGEYLMLDALLKCQKPVTRKGSPGSTVAHDEHLFIITHQAYELWFKQIIYELDSVRALLQRRDGGSESNNLVVTSRLSRITLIWKVYSMHTCHWFSIWNTFFMLFMQSCLTNLHHLCGCHACLCRNPWIPFSFMPIFACTRV